MGHVVRSQGPRANVWEIPREGIRVSDHENDGFEVNDFGLNIVNLIVNLKVIGTSICSFFYYYSG